MIELIERKENLQVSEAKRGLKGRDEVCGLMQQQPWGVVTGSDPVGTESCVVSLDEEKR